MKETQHYALRKPEPTDRFLASDIGANLDAIDEAIHNAAESGTATVDGMDIRPASVTATGDVADAHGTLDAVRQAAKDASNITGGTLPIAHGGTGATTAADAWAALGGGSVGKKNSLAASDIPSLAASKIGSGTLPIARGGTGGGTVAAALAALGITPVVLFVGDTNGNITLAQSAANFTRMTIYFRDNDGQCNSVELQSPNGKLVLLFSSWQGRWNKVRSVRISGTTLTNNYTAQTDTNDNHTDSSNLIYITRILGWKF